MNDSRVSIQSGQTASFSVGAMQDQLGRYQRGYGVDIGVQAGDDLIKVTMDRVRLQEKQKQIFMARDTSAPGGDKYIKPGGVFSPMAKHNKNSVVMMEEILGDIG